MSSQVTTFLGVDFNVTIGDVVGRKFIKIWDNSTDGLNPIRHKDLSTEALDHFNVNVRVTGAYPAAVDEFIRWYFKTQEPRSFNVRQSKFETYIGNIYRIHITVEGEQFQQMNIDASDGNGTCFFADDISEETRASIAEALGSNPSHSKVDEVVQHHSFFKKYYSGR